MKKGPSKVVSYTCEGCQFFTDAGTNYFDDKLWVCEHPKQKKPTTLISDITPSWCPVLVKKQKRKI